MIYREPEIDLECVAAHNARHRTFSLAASPPPTQGEPPALPIAPILLSMVQHWLHRVSNHVLQIIVLAGAASGCRPMQISTGVESSSQSSDIKPLCSGPYPLAYEVTHSTPHREALKNSNVRPGALLHAVMTRTNNSLRARCRGDVPPLVCVFIGPLSVLTP